MTDKLSKERRSWNMSRIKNKNTSPEILLRKALHGKGLRYRLNFKLEGKPDIVFPGKRLAVFVHGCFWHQHGCSATYRPKSNLEFWNKKLDRNIARDKEVKSLLESKGWNTVYVWECEIKHDIEKAATSICTVLESD